MSSYSTKTITRDEARRMIIECRNRKPSVFKMTDRELDVELHEYVYSEDYTDILGVLYNYNIEN